MLITDSRARLVALIATLGVVGATGIAEAAPKKGPSVKYNAAVNQGTFNVTVLTREAGGPTQVHRPIRNAEVMEHTVGHADGGAWDEADCQNAGNAINALLGLAVEQFVAGDWGSAATYVQEAEATEDQALMEGGCSIHHTLGKAPDPGPVPG